jgi:hypothetical protein
LGSTIPATAHLAGQQGSLGLGVYSLQRVKRLDEPGSMSIIGEDAAYDKIGYQTGMGTHMKRKMTFHFKGVLALGVIVAMSVFAMAPQLEAG